MVYKFRDKSRLRFLLFFVVVCSIFFQSSLVRAEEGGFSLLVKPGGGKALVVKGYPSEGLGGYWHTLKVTTFEGLKIKESFEVPRSRKSVFSIRPDLGLSYSFQMTVYDEYMGVLGESELITNVSPSKLLRTLSNTDISTDFSVSNGYSARTATALSSTSASLTGLSAQIDKVSCSAFPYMDMSVQVTKDGQVVEGLVNPDKVNGNFIILEDNLSPSGSVNIIPPQSATLSRMADFAFIFDHSGSMNTKLSALRASIGDFVNQLSASNIDYNLAFMPYENTAILRQDMTSDSTKFLDNIDDFLANWPSGGTENAFLAVQSALSQLTWRPNAQKVIIIFTDEDDDNGGLNREAASTLLNDASATAYAVVDENFGHSAYDFCDVGSITNSTGGRCFDIGSPDYSDILDDITKTVGESYLLRYRTGNLNTSTGLREIDLTVNDGQDTVNLSSSFDPSSCGGLTVDLISSELLTQKKHRDYQPITVQATAFSTDPNLPVTVKLFYKAVGNQSYNEVVLSHNLGSEIYEGVIPGQDVVAPAMQFYVEAENTRQTVTSPAVNASDNPLAVAILPNNAPSVVHVPKVSINKGTDLEISVVASDIDNQVDTVKLYYSLDGLNNIAEMQLSAGDSQNGTYVATIPANTLGNSDSIFYHVEVADDFGALAMSGSAFKPHVTAISDIPVSSECWSESGVVQFCGDALSVSEGIVTLSGNVTVKHVASGLPQLRLSSALTIDTSEANPTFKSVGSGDMYALSVKKNPTQSSLDFFLGNGTIEGQVLPGADGSVSAEFNADELSLYGQSFLSLNGGSGELTIAPDTLSISGAAMQLVSSGSAAIQLITVPDEIVLDQTGSGSSALFEFSLDDLINHSTGYTGFSIILSKNSRVDNFEFSIDILKGTVSLQGDFVLGSRKGISMPFTSNKTVIKKVTGGVTLIKDPDGLFGLLGIDGILLQAQFREPENLFARSLQTLPNTPPSAWGFTPTSLGFSLENLSEGIKMSKASLSLEGAVVDGAYVNQNIKAAKKKWPFSGSLVGSYDFSNGEMEFVGEVMLFEIWQMGNAQILLGSGNAMAVNASVTLPAKEAPLISGQIGMSKYITSDPARESTNGLISGEVKIPDYVPLVGGYTVANTTMRYTQLAEFDTTKEHFFFGTSEFLWLEVGIGYDLLTKTVLHSRSLNSTGRDSALSITGYDLLTGRSQDGLLNRLVDSATDSVEITDASKVHIIRLVSESGVPEFELTTPSGAVFKIDDTSIQDQAFYRGNEGANEGYWAIKNPEVGSYQLNITNLASLGSVDLETLAQNTKPQISLLSQTSDAVVAAGDIVEISWAAEDPDSNAKISLYYDSNNTGFDGGLIVNDIEEDSDVTSYQWTIPEGISGDYYIYAVIDDGQLGADPVYSVAKLTIPKNGPTVPQSFQVTADDGSATVSWDFNDALDDVAAYRLHLRQSGSEVKNTIAVYDDIQQYTFDNLGNGESYDIAISASNSDGEEGNRSEWVSFTPQGLSQNGPPDLYIDENVTVSVTDSVADVELSVKNSSRFAAFSYTLNCWGGQSSEDNLLASVSSTGLEGNSDAVHQFSFDAMNYPDVLDFGLLCKISDVSLGELNERNNTFISSSLLQEALNSSPIAALDTFETLEGTELEISGLIDNDTDADGDTLGIVYIDSTSQNGGSINSEGGVFTYYPTNGFVGTDSFNYIVSDGNGGTSTGVVNISVNQINILPVANNDSFTADSGIPVTGNVLANDSDADSDALSASLVSASSTQGGTVAIAADGAFTYTSATDFEGDDTFQYIVADGKGGTSTGMVTISVKSIGRGDGTGSSDSGGGSINLAGLLMLLLLNTCVLLFRRKKVSI